MFPVIAKDMFFSLIKIFPLPGVEDMILDVLDSMKGPVTALADCLGCSISIEASNDGGIFYMEQWRSRESLERHLRSALYVRLLEAIEHSSQAPEVMFYEVNEAGGLELVEKVRTSLTEKMEERE